MSSWNEKPVVVPTVNVNLKPCDCGADSLNAARRAGNPNPVDALPHLPTCAGAPVLIPCPLPRSVTFTVRLGECDCALSLTPQTAPEWHHASRCPARPIRVSCSISGKTWEESEVVEVEILISSMSIDDRNRIYAACRELWALVKALVLGEELNHPASAKAQAFSVQRDAVYAALVEKVRVEQADDATTRDLIKAVPSLKMRDVTEATASTYLSERALAAYVERLVEQVGVLQ